MKILVLTEMFPTRVHQYSGIFILELLKRLNKLGRITVINPKAWFPSKLSKKFMPWQVIPFYEEIEHIPVYHPRQLILPKANRMFFTAFTFFFSTLFLLRKQLRYFDFDVVCGVATCPAGFASVLISKLYKRPVVVNVRGSDINQYPNYFFLRKMVLFSLRYADFIITTSNALKEKAIGLGMDKLKIKTIVNGVDSNKFRPQNKAILRSRYGISNDTKVIVYVGNLLEIKGITHLIQAFKRLINKIIPLELLIIGDGYLSVTLKDLVKRLRIDSHVRFLGQIDHDAIPDYIGMSDILVLPSLSEGMPNVIKESLACGIPVVATEVGGVPELITSDHLGILVPPANIDVLSDAIEIAIGRTWSQEQLIRHSKQFTWEKTAELTKNVYKEVLEE